MRSTLSIFTRCLYCEAPTECDFKAHLFEALLDERRQPRVPVRCESCGAEFSVSLAYRHHSKVSLQTRPQLHGLLARGKRYAQDLQRQPQPEVGCTGCGRVFTDAKRPRTLANDGFCGRCSQEIRRLLSMRRHIRRWSR